MATEQSSSESPSRKRPRRSKQDPQFVFDNPAGDTTTELDTNKRTPTKTKIKTMSPVESPDASADLYEPGDIVWCKLGGFPWWPALICRCATEGGIHTKTLNSNNKPKRLFFVYFYGKYLEYSWISTRWLLKYAGLSNFIQHAEAAVQQAATKSEQQELANRYQLKVSMKKRVQWDEAIELADRALTMTKEERIEEFGELLKEALDQSKSVRRRKTSVDRSQDEEDDSGNKQQNTKESSISPNTSTIAEATEEIKTKEKPVITPRKPLAFTQNGSTKTGEDEQVEKKKRKRKEKSDVKTESNTSISTTDHNQSPKTRTKTPSKKDQTSSTTPARKSRRSEKLTNGNEAEYDYIPTNKQTTTPIVQLIQTNNPPLSNYEQKQIVEGLLNHSNEKTLTFDEAQTYANNKAMEIVFENHNYRMNNVAPEWFYESILLKYPAVVFKYRTWFENIQTDIIPNGNDMIKLKQWQIALMLHAQIKAEQSQQQQPASTQPQQTSSNEN